MKTLRPKKSPELKIKRGLHGLGLVSLEPIRKGRTIVEYTGRLVDDEEADSLSNRYIFEVRKNVNIDGSSRKNIARYVNHACRPNCDYRTRGNRVFYYAIKNIKAGEELTADYGKEYFDHWIKPYGCRCNAKRHRGEKRKQKKKNPA